MFCVVSLKGLLQRCAVLLPAAVGLQEEIVIS